VGESEGLCKSPAKIPSPRDCGPQRKSLTGDDRCASLDIEINSPIARADGAVALDALMITAETMGKTG